MKVLVYNHHYDPETKSLHLSHTNCISPVSPQVMAFPSPEGTPYLSLLLQRYEGKIVDPDTIITAIEAIRTLMRTMREIPTSQVVTDPSYPLTQKVC